MRPDASCQNSPVPRDFDVTGYCEFHYIQGNKHRCKGYDALKALRNKNRVTSELMVTFGITKEHIYTFYIFCLDTQCTSPLFGVLSPCIKCGQCCRGIYSIAKWKDSSKLDPKTGLSDPVVPGQSKGICEKLTYDPGSDNGVDDMGYRCSVYGTAAMPDLCRDYPDGKTEEFFEAWFNSLTGVINNPLFSLCPFEVEEVI